MLWESSIKLTYLLQLNRATNMTRRSCGVSTVGIICSGLLITVGSALIATHVFDTVTHNNLKKRSVLVEHNPVFESVKTPPPSVFTEFFFFNVTNVDEFLSGAKPQVTQVGPYTYRKTNNTESFVLVREKSVGDPSKDHITTVNIPAWHILNKAKGNFFMKTMIAIYINSLGIGLFTTRTVDELLWGYEDPLLQHIAKINPEVDTMFGLMVNKTKGDFVPHTGEQNYIDHGRVVTWKGQSHLTSWTSDQSNNINGSDGSAVYRPLDKKDRIYFFTPDFCRPIYMEFEKEVEVNGTPAYRFSPPQSVFSSNESPCVNPMECLSSGLLNASPCHGGAPVVASFPHFYLADHKYVTAIEGMSPEKSHHQTFVEVNPTTMLIVRANRGAQVNILISKIPGIKKTETLNPTVFPVMFYNERLGVDDASAAGVHRSVLVEHNPVFESVKSPPPSDFTEFFFFNVTNKDDFLSGAKPQVTQVGPYTYRCEGCLNIVENGTTQSKHNTKNFVLVKEKSVGDPSKDHITTVNIPAWYVMNKLKGSFWTMSMMSVWMNSIGSGLFTTRTVDELLWGYEDPVLERVALSRPEVDKMFGLMVNKTKGDFVPHTSEHNYMDHGRVVTWKGQSHLTFWTSDQSNNINGSDGSAVHPSLDKNERIYFFTPEFCRPIYMEFEKEVEVNGTSAYRFSPARSVFSSNESPCVGPTECVGSGLWDASPCHGGAPVVASFPHFYLAHEKYVAAIGGMSPEKSRHQTFVDVNPKTWMIIRANRGAQVNILMSRIPGFKQTKTLNHTVFPVMFYNERLGIDDASVSF